MKLFLVCENRILRESLARLFRKRGEFSLVGQTSFSSLAIEQLTESQCEVVLLDHSSTQGNSEDLVQQIALALPRCGIVVLGMEEDPATFLKMVRAGPAGYVLKDATAKEILLAVRSVARGEAVCPPKLCSFLLQHVASESRIAPQEWNPRLTRKLELTRRQQQLVSLLALGLTNKEIARQLNLSEFTVKNHVRRLLRQVNASDRLQALEMIRSHGFTMVDQRPVESPVAATPARCRERTSSCNDPR